MRRFFISQHPTFGRGKSLTVKGVEASPYYWWWLALTLNDDYVAFCNRADGENRFKTNSRLTAVYADFGDVRYEGDKYAAFKCWWQVRVDGEERGVHLFAEPLQNFKVGLINDEKAAAEAIHNEELLVIRVPKAMKRTYIDNALNRILKVNLVGEKGRVVRNPNRSNALYHISKSIKVAKYKIAFDMLGAKIHADQNGEKISNKSLAKIGNLEVPVVEGSEDDFAYINRVLSTKVSRYIADARAAIENVTEGMFP